MNNKLRMGFASALVTVLLASTLMSDQVSAAALQPGKTGTAVMASVLQPGGSGTAVLPAAAAARVSVNSSAQPAAGALKSALSLTPSLAVDLKLSISDESTLEIQIKGSEENVQEDLRNAQILAFLDTAQQQLGKSYVFGSVGPNSFDCSGLVYYCLNQAGLTIDRATAAGYSKISDWEKITSMDDLQIGDILFFRNGGKSVRHAAIYIGNGNMIDASTSVGEVVQRSCTTSYWTRNFVCARRVF